MVTYFCSLLHTVGETECGDGARGRERLTASFLLLLRHCCSTVGAALVLRVFHRCHQKVCWLQQMPCNGDSRTSFSMSIHPFSAGGCWILFQLLFLSQIFVLITDYTLDTKHITLCSLVCFKLFFAIFISVSDSYMTSLPISTPFFAVLVPLTRPVHQPATRILSLQSQIKKQRNNPPDR